ncbi:MAG TPA: TolC family protein, partial [Gemmatimonadales bacterium]|nr:TolC family protein [Gemmatimonadales bacterium]
MGRALPPRDKELNMSFLHHPLRLVALALGLAACAVGPTTRVTPATHPGPRAADSVPGRSARAWLDSLEVARAAEPSPLPSPAPLALDPESDRAWLEVLRDPAVVRLVETALANNREYRIAVARVQEYRALLGVARSELFPQVSASASGSTNQIVFGSFPT